MRRSSFSVEMPRTGQRGRCCDVHCVRRPPTDRPEPDMAAVQTPTATFDVGSLSIVPAGSNGSSAPAGTLHLVHGWEPLCGGERVRFVFPGRRVDTAAACAKCAAK